jgi:cell division protein FtsL
MLFKEKISFGEVQFFTKIKNFIFSSQGLPLILMFLTLGILFVVFRMKSVELDYKMVELNQELSKKKLIEKELEADKAGLLSTNNLRDLAKKYDLKPPKQTQIILIPENWNLNLP